MRAKLPRGTLHKFWHDPENWRAYSFYYCPGDPRSIVPKRNKWAGWTINCAHASAWAALGVGIACPVAIIVYLEMAGNAFWGIAGLALFSVVSVALCPYLSSTARFEEKE
jgi:hypothetical protein